MANPKSVNVVLMGFFGKQPGQNLGEFNAELKQCSDAERLDMAQQIAKRDGMKQEDCGFPLS